MNRTRRSLLLAAAALLAAPAGAQIADVVLCQTSTTEVQLVLFTDLDNDGQFASPGEARALYTNGLNSSSLTSNRDVVFRVEAGKTSAYWVDSVIDKVFRGRDLDGDGTIGASEAVAFRDSATLDGTSRANGITPTPDGAVWWSSDLDAFRGVFRLKDLNADGDANDAGEQIVMVNGSATHPIQTPSGPLNVTAGTFARMTTAGNGAVVFNGLDHSAQFRFEDLNSNGDVLDANESIVFLNPTGETAGLPQHPDFAAALAGSSPRSLVVDPVLKTYGWLSLLTTQLEGSAEVVYAACDSSTTSTFGTNQFGEPINGLVFRCVDQNADGDANDAGEVGTFYDGSGTSAGLEVFEKVIGLSSAGGWLYVCDLNNSTNPVFHRFRDLNADGDAMDAGEGQLFLWNAALFKPNPPFAAAGAPFVAEIGATAPGSFAPGAGCPAPFNYCTAKVSSSGCTPAIASSGTPSLASPAGFTVTSTSLEHQKFAITFFGTSGQNGAPFQGGFLCVKVPIYRLALKNSGGAGACQGAVSYTLGDYVAHPSGGPFVVAGAVVDSQTWFRDPGSPSTTGLSNGLEFQACP